MNTPHSDRQLFSAPPRPSDDSAWIPELVDCILESARAANATDIHLVPTSDSLRMFWRVDGVLADVAQLDADLTPRVVARLKVLAQLLTYRTDMPQEGRIRREDTRDETRVSTFPTLFGEKAVVRLFAEAGRFQQLSQLGLPEEILERLQHMLSETSGVILLTGPAGSGKTTTIYASLREILDESGAGRSLVSVEDPIEVVVPGVAQSQVDPPAGFDLAVGLRSLMRQDPEVIMVGEIRDKATAEGVFQAALTGHLVITTFHAGSAAGAVSRLADMGIEPYLLRSTVLSILCQRLVRRLCVCADQHDSSDLPAGMENSNARRPVGCPDCGGSGYRGRMLLAEMLIPDDTRVGRAILAGQDADELERLAVDCGMISQRERAAQAVADGVTSIEEILRVLGPKGLDDHSLLRR